ncbi:hypothetical protein, partial [Ruminococcus sp.]|uniref:hypothetical protein n=1 Tax=Ruminococcus sp. TaxID=41978 RepID=UPI002E81712B
NKVDVLGLYDISGTTPKVAALNTSSDATKQELLFKAYDQYGNELSALKTEDVTITVSGNTGLEKATLGTLFETRTVNDQTYFAIPMKGTLAKGTSVVTIVGNSVGLLSSTPIEVKAQVVVADLTITPSDTLYVGTKTEVNYVAKDTEGNEVTDYSKLNALLPASTFTNADFSWERQADGSAKLFIKPSVGEGKTLANNPSGTNSSTAVLTTQVGTNVHTITVAVFAKKVSTAIIGVKGDAAKVSIIGAQHLLFKQSDFIIQDQYGNLMTDAEVAANESGYKIVAVKEPGGKGFEDAIASNGTAISETETTTMFDVTTKATETGVSTYTFKLQNGGTDIPNSDCQISLTAVGIDSITDITIADLPEMYVAVDGNATNDAANSASIPLVVTGKYGALNVVINNAFYNVIGEDKPTTHLKYEAGTISATGADVLKDDNPSSVVETIEIVVNNSAGTSVKKNVTISSVAPAVKSVKLGAGKTFALTSYDLGTAVNYASISG